MKKSKSGGGADDGFVKHNKFTAIPLSPHTTVFTFFGEKNHLDFLVLYFADVKNSARNGKIQIVPAAAAASVHMKQYII